MTMPEPSAPRRGRTGRRTAFALALLAIVVCGVGLTLRTAAAHADEHPAGALVALLALGCAGAAGLRGRHRLRGAFGATAGWRGDRAAPAPEAVPPVDYTAMDAAEFERAIADLCARDGCTDVQVVGGAGDLGADVLATTPDGRRLVVQCKRYGPDHKVGSQDLQRFGGTCFTIHGAHIAALVTTSDFTGPALEYAARGGILCLDARALAAWSDGGAPPPWRQGGGAEGAERGGLAPGAYS
ncbi:restriction endonuclease [Streptomyces mobaraensis NBRC 13819 = DSM 40847]|uniref:Restriction endonuclease n=1 Tax=Streptomyces mobaraensis (strain ATCC 29032 / DSM 40847 / JCM 4168 / NBRC 13819 / NCIMB 11159 / IPCR 16-22) TaxID=1223523 RepID=M3BMY3_STRM1|nr:restriction endonuclease [Streptomyces mobaraensis]EMF00945.1 restriction endonuclease [Streptomyces mobaraensis NBRC 13819 = DSM 40847]QTT72381.1 restriction endonuclease [Streptomyces mobaraensis NBRC 13819 = DSM 40847]